VYTWTKSLLETITDPREHVHKELLLMIRGEVKMTKSLIDTKRWGLEAKIAEDEARAERVRIAGTGTGAAEPPKDQQLVGAYRNKLKIRAQGVGKSLQEFSTAIEQFAHHAYSTLPEDDIRREAGKFFADGVEDPAIKIRLLL
jgi:hypothetical protein